MLERVYHLISGYGEFQVLGDEARFFNMAAKSGIGLWGFDRADGVAIARIKARKYKTLLPIARRSHTRLKLRVKRGLPFQVHRLGKRKGLVIGAVCGVLLYAFLSGFVWSIGISGTQLATDRELLAAAGKYGVFTGCSKGELNPKYSAQGILSEVKSLSWAAVNTDGCHIEIVVKEKAEKPEITDELSLSNIVSTRDGEIVAIEAEQGRPEVKLGETVVKGQLLISGLFEEEADPYGPQPEEPLQVKGAARGKVIAQTYQEFTVQISSVKKQEQLSGDGKTNLTLCLFGLRIPLGINYVPQSEHRTYKRVYPIKALGTQLPVAIEAQVYEFVEEKERLLSEEEQKEAALMKLRQMQKATLGAGSSIVKEELTYSFTDGMCLLNAKCRCNEEIGEVQQVLLK